MLQKYCFYFNLQKVVCFFRLLRAKSATFLIPTPSPSPGEGGFEDSPVRLISVYKSYKTDSLLPPFGGIEGGASPIGGASRQSNMAHITDQYGPYYRLIWPILPTNMAHITFCRCINCFISKCSLNFILLFANPYSADRWIVKMV